MKSQVLHTVWCNISGEAAGGIWNWSLLGVKGLAGITEAKRLRILRPRRLQDIPHSDVRGFAHSRWVWQLGNVFTAENRTIQDSGDVSTHPSLIANPDHRRANVQLRFPLMAFHNFDQILVDKPVAHYWRRCVHPPVHALSNGKNCGVYQDSKKNDAKNNSHDEQSLVGSETNGSCCEIPASRCGRHRLWRPPCRCCGSRGVHLR